MAATAAASTPAGDRDAFPVTAAALISATSAPPTVTTAAPPVATTAPPVSTTAALELAPITPAPPLPRLEVWLLDGCDRSYLAGEEVEIRAQSTAAGVLDVHVRDPGGRRQRLVWNGKDGRLLLDLRCLEAGADLAVVGRAAILHHDFPARVQADAAFAAASLPVTPQHLRAEGAGEAFLRYLRDRPGFIQDEPA